jgi:ubiquinone/menaquinone biosynthesis C-methylase UbiE
MCPGLCQGSAGHGGMQQNSSLSGQTASPSNPDFEAVKARQQNGNATLAAARRWCDVTSTDYVPALLEKGRARAAAEGLDISFQPADAEALPFADTTFDVVLSTFGEMFTPNQNTAASEMLRVCWPSAIAPDAKFKFDSSTQPSA